MNSKSWKKALCNVWDGLVFTGIFAIFVEIVFNFLLGIFTGRLSIWFINLFLVPAMIHLAKNTNSNFELDCTKKKEAKAWTKKP